jgi:phosphoribosylglycinamide formyltransferase-1
MGGVRSPMRLVVLISGTGTLLRSLLEACGSQDYPARVVAVGSDRHGIAGLDVASAAGVPTFVVPFPTSGVGTATLPSSAQESRPGTAAVPSPRDAWNRDLREAVLAHRPDLVVSAGFMRLLGPDFLSAFPHRVLNTHPALLPAFPGAHAVADALAYGVRLTGSTIHLVDEGVDTGPVLAQRAVPVRPDDDEAQLHERIKVVERDLLVDVVSRMARHGWQVHGRQVVLEEDAT